MEQVINEKKKIKLNLEDIKIQSFVTSLNEQQQNEIMGGATCTNGTCSCCLCTVNGTCC